jgi:uncharacterized protein DUF4129
MLGAIWKRWNWLDDGLIPLAGVLMAAAWGYPLFATFLRDPGTGTQNPGFTFWLCLIVLFGGFLAGRLASQNSMGIVIVIIGGLATIMIVMLLTVPSHGESIDVWLISLSRLAERGRLTGEILPVPLVIVILVTMLWTRGVRLASMQHQGGIGAFVVGVIAIAGLLFVSEMLPSDAGTDVPAQSDFWQNLGPGLVPLFLLSIPAAIVFSIFGSTFGEWANTAGEVSLVIGILLLNLIMPFGPSPRHLVGWLVLFLASGLAALALMSVSSTLREQERLTGIRLKIDRYWVMIMMSVVCAILLVGVVIGQLVAPSIFLRVLALLRPVWWLVRQVLLYIVMIFAYLFFSLLEPLLAGLQDRPVRAPNTFMSPIEAESMGELAQETAGLSPAFILFLQIVLALGALSVIALLFYLAVRKRQTRPPVLDEVVETRETILSMNLIQKQLQGLLDGLRRRRRESLFDTLGPAGDPRRRIREMYQQVLAQAIHVGTPREKGQTPQKYGTTLSGLCPEEESSIHTLTQAYVAARYGTEPPTESQAQAASSASERIQARLQRDRDVVLR